jgi:hypothetical protein
VQVVYVGPAAFGVEVVVDGVARLALPGEPFDASEAAAASLLEQPDNWQAVKPAKSNKEA